MREKLIEILQKIANDDSPCVDGLYEWADDIADKLIANGVVVLNRDGNDFNSDLYCPYCGNNLSVTDTLERSKQ